MFYNKKKGKKEKSWDFRFTTGRLNNYLTSDCIYQR